MSDLISRQAAIDTLMDEFKRVPTNAIRAKNALEKLPYVQTEIIHCENCKNWDTGWRNSEWGLGYHWCSCVDVVRRSDWFCADAERRTDGRDQSPDTSQSAG